VIAVPRMEEICEEYGGVDAMAFILHNMPMHLDVWPHGMKDGPEGCSSWNVRDSVDYCLSSPQSTA
jgi:hypothetical protein